MGFDLSFLKRYFKFFYWMIIGFVGITILFFALLYWSRLGSFKEEIYDLQQGFISIFMKDYEASLKYGEPAQSFYLKYSSAHLNYIENAIVVKPNGKAFFTANPEKQYQFIGVQSKGTVLLEGVTLRDNLVSERTASDGLSLYVLTGESFVKTKTFETWIKEQRVHVSVSILVPLIIMLLLMMIEDKIIKELEGKLNAAFELAKSHEAAKDELYSGLFYQNRSIMLLIDPETGLVVKGNESAKRYYGYSFAEESVHISQINTMPSPVLQEVMAGAMGMHKNYFQFQHRLKNGQIRDVEVYSGPVMIEGQRLLCSIVHDITDKIKAEHQLLAQKQEMEQSLQAKSQILATISHEIKTPITGILHNLQELSDQVKDPLVLNQLDFLKYNVDSLNRLVFDLLDYARLEVGNIRLYSTPFDLLECLEGTLKLFRPVAKERRIRMAIETEGLLKTKYVGDRFRITQILNNLVSNSLKYTSDGTVTLKASSEALDKLSLVTIEVIDTGIGMNSEVISQIFSPYYTTDQTGEYKGTGLGLAICRMIVEAMDGTLEIESAPNQGTKITLILELENDEATELSLMDQSLAMGYNASPQSKSPHRVLLVDDDAMNLIYIEKLLKNISDTLIAVETAYNGQEALELLSQGQFTHVFSDYQLPDTDGLSLFEEMRACISAEAAPICLLMSADTVEIGSRANGFLLKPIELDHLLPYFKTADKEGSTKDGFLERLNSHRYLGHDAWINLSAQMQMEDMEGMLSIFSRSLGERLNLLPKAYKEGDREKILRILHAIKGSISYFRSDTFLAKLNALELLLAAEGAAEATLAYEEFLAELAAFWAEADFIAKQFLMRRS